MSSQQMKFHMTALSVIVLSVVVVFFLTQPQPQTAEEKGTYQTSNDRFVQVSRATYGKNCNHLIKRANDYRKRSGDAARYQSVPREEIQSNNVLLEISDICNGLVTCEIPVTHELFSEDPYPSCVKELEVEYRCFSFDRLWRSRGLDRETIIIDCSPKTS